MFTPPSTGSLDAPRTCGDVGMSGLPPRLQIRGQQILYPDGTRALLRGMNVMFELDSEYAFPRADTDDLLFELLPGTNLLRLVMLRWDDRPTRTKNGDGNDCSAGNLHSGRSIQSRCIEQFKDILRWCGPMAHAQYPMPQHNLGCPRRLHLSPDAHANQVRA